MTGADGRWMRRALSLAKRAEGRTAPNPMVGAVIVRRGRVVGEGWHRRAGNPHAEVEALRDAQRRGHDPRGATLYVTLEPCCTTGRTPPCTDAIVAAHLARVVVAAVDPNPRHAGRGLDVLREAGIEIVSGVGGAGSARLNEAFNHWITTGRPWVVVKSKWITGPRARAAGMRLRRASGAMIVGVETVLKDDPSLTVRSGDRVLPEGPVRIVLDSKARTPLAAAVVKDAWRARTRIVVARDAPARRVAALEKRVEVWRAPQDPGGRVDVRWVLRKLGRLGVTQVLVEGGGVVPASVLTRRLAHRVVFFYAPLVLGGATARKAVAGEGARDRQDLLPLDEVEWRRLGDDLMMTALVRTRIGG